MKYVFAFLILVFAILGIYASMVEPFQLRVTEYSIETDKWKGQPDLRVALVTDTHAIWPWMTVSHIDRIVTEVNALKPDLILLLGDYVATHPFGIQIPPEEGVKPYESLNARCGVFSVLGNHDLHGNGSEGWPDAMRSSSIPLLENQSEHVECEGFSFYVSGLEDLWWQKPDIDKALDSIPIGEPVIMMMHNPDLFVEIPSMVTLSVAGHTHAGQIRFPFIGAVESVIPSRYGKRFVYGHITENNKDLIVSAGVGNTGIPLRFLNKPEVVLITLSSE
tara:strand:+ start:1875 stop:2705 length:831 start_codon:yes stop_codon:yes gene_type:complete